MNKKLIEAIEVLKQFPKESLFYWIKAYKNLSISEKGYLILYFNLL